MPKIPGTPPPWAAEFDPGAVDRGTSEMEQRAADLATAQAMADTERVSLLMEAQRRREEARGMDEQRRQEDAERLAQAREQAKKTREEYRETLRRSGRMSGAEIGGLVGAALADALAVGLDPKGQRQSMFPAAMQIFLTRHDTYWKNQVEASLDAAVEGKEGVEEAIAMQREGERQSQLQAAALAEEVAQKLDIIAAREKGTMTAVNAQTAAAQVRAQAAAAMDKAAMEAYKLETDRLGKVGQAQRWAEQSRLEQAAIEQREAASRREAGVRRQELKLRGRDIARLERRDEIDAELARAKVGREEAQTLREEGVVGFDGKPFLAGTSKRADELQGLRSNAEQAVNLIDKIQEFRKKYGAELTAWSEADQRALANYGELLLRLKEVHGLGVISGPDMELMRNIIGAEPGTVSEELVKEVFGRLDETRSNIIDSTNTRFRNAQYTGPAWAPSRPETAPAPVKLDEEWLRQAQSRVQPASGKPVPVEDRLAGVKGLRENYREAGGAGRAARGEFRSRLVQLRAEEEEILRTMEDPSEAERLWRNRVFEANGDEQLAARRLSAREREIVRAARATPEQVKAQREFLRELTGYQRSLPRE